MKKLKINYIAESIIPSRSANSIHVMHMCSEWAKLGHSVTLVVSKAHSSRTEQGVLDVYEFYGVSNNFNIHYITKSSFKGAVYCNAIKMGLYCKKQGGLNYSRHYWASVFCTLLRIEVSHEFHGPLPNKGGWKGKLAQRFINSKYLLNIFVISEALKHIFIKDGVSENLMTVAHDAATEATKREEEITDTVKIGYVGHLYGGRGIELIFKVAKQRPNYQFHLIGGNEKDIKLHKESNPPKNIIFHGFLPHSVVGDMRNSMDILLAPYQREVKIWGGARNTVDYMSPLKIFEYMSSNKPIICSDLPVLREVLNESNAILCHPDNVSEWIEAIDKLLANEVMRYELSTAGLKDFRDKYTWEKRAQYILKAIDE